MLRNRSLVSNIFLAMLGALHIGCAAGIGTAGLGTLAEPELIGSCNPHPCIRAAVGDVPALPDGVSPELRNLIEADVGAALFAPIDGDRPQATREALFAELKARYEEGTQGGQSDTLLDWEITREATILFQNPEVITIDVRSDGFLGGAHGFSERRLLAFDVQRSKRLVLADLVEPSSEGIFHKLIEAQFRRAREIPTNESLADAGYFVKPGGPIAVPENFGITPGGLVLHYNPYEIAPYVYGSTEIVIPMEAFRGVLRDSSKPLLASLVGSGPRA